MRIISLTLLVLILLNGCKSQEYKDDTEIKCETSIDINRKLPSLQLSFFASKDEINKALSHLIKSEVCDSIYIVNYCFPKDSVEVVISDERRKCPGVLKRNFYNFSISKEGKVMIDYKLFNGDRVEKMKAFFLKEYYSKTSSYIALDWDVKTSPDLIRNSILDIKKSYIIALDSISNETFRNNYCSLSLKQKDKLNSELSFKLILKNTRLRSEPNIPK